MGTDLTNRLVEGKLQATVAYCWERSAFYRERLRGVGAEPGDIRNAEDLNRLPVLLDKDAERELQERSRQEAGHPFGDHLCAPLDEVVAVSSTSGTTGDPTFYAFTAADVGITDELWAAACRQGGVRPGDTVLHAFGLSMFLAGVPVVRALERMGARPVPVGAEGGTEKLLRIARLVRPVAICCTPSLAEYLAEKANAVLGAPLSSLGIRHVFCAGEPGAGLPDVRTRISEAFGGVTVTDMLGGAHGIMNVSCSANAGMHILGDQHSLQQLIEPESGAPVEIRDGAIGLRVKTTLDWQAQPQLRASVGDVYEILVARCECGLSSPRVRVIGRIDDLLIIKGVKLYPAAIQNLVHEFSPRLTGHFRILLDGPPPRVDPPLRLLVEVAADGGGVTEELARRMHDRFAVTPVIEAAAPGSLPRSTHKQKLIEVRK
jgi:phenylacetate-CoA ligase